VRTLALATLPILVLACNPEPEKGDTGDTEPATDTAPPDADGSDFLTTGLTTPHGIVYDASEGLFFVGDRGEDRIYRMSPDGTLELFAEGVSPHAFTLDADGALYVSDHTTDPNRILRFEPPK